ncbi:MAG: methyltransferase domain-containing protein [Xanthobacteraceae bacterium]
MTILVLVIIALAAIWVAWRLRSRRELLPCPAEFAWLVEMENPLARATNSDHVVRQLALPRGARVMDVGCGPGRVTIPLARAVGPDGEVLALDVQAAMLSRVADRAAKEGLANVRPIHSDVRSASIASNSLDAAVMVMALGEVPEGGEAFSGEVGTGSPQKMRLPEAFSGEVGTGSPQKMRLPEAFSGEVGAGSPLKMRLLNKSVFPFIFAALKPGGRLLVGESIFDPHFVSRTKVRAQAAAAGFAECAYAGNIFGYSLVFEKAAI